MNTRLLRKVAKHISEEPRRLAMSRWIQRGDPKSGDLFAEGYCHTTHKFAPCGTAACIAGWTTILGGGNTDLPSVEGQKLLRLDSRQAGRLFWVQEWPEPFRTKYYGSKSLSTRVKLAVARIEHFIKTKGAE